MPNIQKPAPFLDTFTIEIRYAYGHRYFDLCGQIMIDIEQHFPGWLAGELIAPNTATASNPAQNYAVRFNRNSYTFTATRLKTPLDLNALSQPAAEIWNLVRDNLGLTEIVRIGCRYQYLLPKDSSDKAELAIAKAPVNVIFPDSLTRDGYKPIERQAVIVFQKDKTEYRVSLQNIIRTHAVPEANLTNINPKLLSHNQRQVRIELLKHRAQYNANPMHAVCLDIDCAQYAPELVSAKEYILTEADRVNRDFVGMFGGL